MEILILILIGCTMIQLEKACSPRLAWEKGKGLFLYYTIQDKFKGYHKREVIQIYKVRDNE